MKKAFYAYPLTFISLIFIAFFQFLGGCSDSNTLSPRPTAVSSADTPVSTDSIQFPYLLYSIDTLNEWLNNNIYKNYIFQFYSPNMYAADSFRLICYPQERNPKGHTDDLVYPQPADTLGILQENSVTFSSRIIFGNLALRRKILHQFVKAAEQDSAKFLLFVPYESTLDIHITYHISIVFPSGNKGQFIYPVVHLERIKDKEVRNMIKTDNNGNSYIELNPCPPATMHLADDSYLEKEE